MNQEESSFKISENRKKRLPFKVLKKLILISIISYYKHEIYINIKVIIVMNLK